MTGNVLSAARRYNGIMVLVLWLNGIIHECWTFESCGKVVNCSIN